MKGTKKLLRCRITSESVAELTEGAWSVAERFYIVLKNDDVAVIQNILLCGLGVGDEIRVQTVTDDYGEDSNQFVKVEKRNCKVYAFKYELPGYDLSNNKMPNVARKFLQILETLKIKFEPMTPGFAAVQCPIDMDDDVFFKLINQGPFEFATTEG